MIKKNRMVKTLSLTMSLMMAFSSLAWADSLATKEETVYVNLTQEGKVESIIVSDWLHSEDMDVEFDDISALKGIKNVKGEEEPLVEGDSLKWKTDKGEIYYQGESDKKLPFEFEISYMMDGEKISPELLAGKSGKLKITMNITNNDAHEVMLSSGSKRLYTPFAVATVFNFSTDVCKNVTVNTGKILNDGNNVIVTYAAVPGLKESLDIDDEDFDDMFDLPEELILEADVYDFEMGDIMITAVSDSSIINDIKGFDDVIDETIDGVDDLSDASEDVQDGIETLNNGTDELLDKFGDFNDGMFFLKDSMSVLEDNINGRILDGSIDLSEGVEEFKEKTDELKDGTEELHDGSEELMDAIREAYWGASELKTGSTTLRQGIEYLIASISSAMDTDKIKEYIDGAVNDAVEKAGAEAITEAINNAMGTDYEFNSDQIDILESVANDFESTAGDDIGQTIKGTLDAKLEYLKENSVDGGLNALLVGAQTLEGGLKALSSGMKSLSNGAEDLNDGMKELDDNAELFQTGASDLSDGANDLSDGLEALGDGAASLREGVDGLADASNTANDGIDTLQNGTKDLFEGYDTFSDEGVDELHDKVFEKTDEYDELFEIKDQLAILSDQYQNFSGIGENMDGKVKFIIKIDSIELETIEVEAPAAEEEKTGFITWVKNIWNKIFKK